MPFIVAPEHCSKCENCKEASAKREQKQALQRLLSEPLSPTAEEMRLARMAAEAACIKIEGRKGTRQLSKLSQAMGDLGMPGHESSEDIENRNSTKTK